MCSKTKGVLLCRPYNLLVPFVYKQFLEHYSNGQPSTNLHSLNICIIRFVCYLRVLSTVEIIQHWWLTRHVQLWQHDCDGESNSTCTPCLTPHFNAPCHYTQFLNLSPLNFGFIPFAWPCCIMLTPTYTFLWEYSFLYAFLIYTYSCRNATKV